MPHKLGNSVKTSFSALLCLRSGGRLKTFRKRRPHDFNEQVVTLDAKLNAGV
jgi:hypothetical protein